MVSLAQSCMSSGVARGSVAFFTGSALNGSSVASVKSVRVVAPPARICAVKTPEECNDEECAPTKEVGKLSMDWKTEDNTKVTGTSPPLARQEKKWTGYVEKDTAGQTNIYAVEPTIYVAESAISTGSAGGAADGSDKALAVAGGLALIAVASAASILLYVGQNAPAPATTYDGPPLSYYVSKFTQETAAPPDITAQVPPIPESPPLADESSLSKPEVALSSESTSAESEAVPEKALEAL